MDEQSSRDSMLTIQASYKAGYQQDHEKAFCMSSFCPMQRNYQRNSPKLMPTLQVRISNTHK